MTTKSEIYSYTFMVVGGNIRMEVGSTDRTWYKNCIELVTSRFSADDFAPFGIIGIRACKVSRVHNRFLQDCFDRETERKVSHIHSPCS